MPRGAQGNSNGRPQEPREESLLLSDLRLEELVGRHDAIAAGLSAPDPLLEAYAAEGEGQISTNEPEYSTGSGYGPGQNPSKVSSLAEYKAHAEYAKRRRELEKERRRLLSMMADEGMPVGVWVLCGAGRYVRLEQHDVPEPEPPASLSGEDEPDAGSTTDSAVQDAEKDRATERATSPSSSRSSKNLCFYSVRKEALEGLSLAVPGAEVERVSRQIEHFEAISLPRRLCILYYPLLILACVAAVWLLVSILVPTTVTEVILGVIVAGSLFVVAASHLDAGRIGPRAIRAQKRHLTLRYGDETEPLVMRYRAHEAAGKRSADW